MATSNRKAQITGKRVASHRARLGLSGPQLAARLKIDRTHVWRIECGETVPSLDLLEKMAELFGVSLDELRGRKQAAH